MTEGCIPDGVVGTEGVTKSCIPDGVVEGEIFETGVTDSWVGVTEGCNCIPEGVTEGCIPDGVVMTEGVTEGVIEGGIFET